MEVFHTGYERIYVDHPQTTLQIILYCKLSFNVVAFTFAVKHLISWAISFSKGCSGGGEGGRDAYVWVRNLFLDYCCDKI